MSSIDLSGRVALVTGGSRGIGRAIAVGLAEAGADVAVNYVANETAATGALSAVKAAGRRGIAVRADVADAAAVDAMVAEVEAALGPVDILVNNAGIATNRAIEETTEADFVETLTVNLTSSFLCSQAVLPGMRERKWGRLIFITSGAAYSGGRVGVHYSASKGGQEGLARAYANRLIEEGITSNCVAPIQVATDMSPPDRVPKWGLPMGRKGDVDEVAIAAVMLAGNAYMTGQTIHVNGGVYFN
ncbi:MAG: SDR family NAD(P)-dependent oxidoreductase [Alphaproteobacteria bacterium]|jgi:3-oxoacyl-[acyl-carrier protein] reductase